MGNISSHRFARKYEHKSENKVIYIFTEGTKTEPNYFEAIKEELRLNNIDIRIKGTSHNTLSLIEYITDYKVKNNIKTDHLDDDEIWAVFDKDSFDRDFDNAINKAEANGIKVAYSNESFELWFLLHFIYIDSSLTRDIYCEKLTEQIQKRTGDRTIKYNKSMDLYSLIKDSEIRAIKNSEKLLGNFESETSFLKKNPSTTVYLLVKALRKLKQ